MIRRIELWHWMVRDPVSGRCHRSAYRMTEAEARARHPDAERIAESLEVREVRPHDRGHGQIFDNPSPAPPPPAGKRSALE